MTKKDIKRIDKFIKDINDEELQKQFNVCREIFGNDWALIFVTKYESEATKV